MGLEVPEQIRGWLYALICLVGGIFEIRGGIQLIKGRIIHRKLNRFEYNRVLLLWQINSWISGTPPPTELTPQLMKYSGYWALGIGILFISILVYLVIYLT